MLNNQRLKENKDKRTQKEGRENGNAKGSAKIALGWIRAIRKINKFIRSANKTVSQEARG